MPPNHAEAELISVQSLGWIVYVYALALGWVSYALCLRSGQREASWTFDQYLFWGNTKWAAFASMVGAAASATVMFIAFTWAYVMYGWIPYLFAMVPATLGFLLLRRKAFAFFKDEDEGADITIIAKSRFRALIAESRSPRAFVVFSLTYLVVMGCAEVAIFRGAMQILFPGDPWASLSVYVVSLLAGAYVYAGGFRGILITDKLQLTIIVLSVIGIWSFLFKHMPDRVSEHFINNAFLQDTEGNLSYLVMAMTLGLGWFAGAPELWKRVTTLPKRREMKWAITASTILLPLLLSFSLASVIATQITVGSMKHMSDTLVIWQMLVATAGTGIGLCMLFALVTGTFTTLDTFDMTFMQIMKASPTGSVISRLANSDQLRGRKLGVVFMLLCIALATQIDSETAITVGLFAGSFVIPLAIMIHLQPWLCRRLKCGTIPDSVHFVPIIFLAAVMIIMMFVTEHSDQSYTLVPPAVGLADLLSIGAYSIWHRSRVHKRSRDAEVAE